VTNRSTRVCDAGGYRNIEYWEHPFLNGDQLLAWEEAMKMFVDKSGLPGPSTWMGGDFPPDQGDFPVSGICWYEASAYANGDIAHINTLDVARERPFMKSLSWVVLGILPFGNIEEKWTVKVRSLDNITTWADMAKT
jgi:hypothetical protein